MVAGRSFVLDAHALALAKASELLAIDPKTFGQTLALAENEPATELGGAVAMVRIEGPLAQRADRLCGWVDGYDAIAERAIAALEDPGVGAVLLVVDSPGGDLAGLEEGIARMTAARDRTEKPVLAFVDELAASAALWVVATVATSGVFLPRSGRMGSIGVMGAHVDQSKALERAGVAVTLIAEPAGKVAESGYSPLSEVGRARIEERVREGTARFLAAVSAARGIDEKALRALDGAVLSAEAAVKAGLADEIGSLEQAIAAALDAANRRKMKRENQAAASAEGFNERGRARLPADLAGRLELAAFVLEATGATTAEAARGVLEAKLGDAARVPELERRYQELRVRVEHGERERLLEEAVRDLRLEPSLAWSFTIDEKGERRRAFSDWAGPPRINERGEQVGQSLEQLRAFLAAKAPQQLVRAAQQPPARPGAAGAAPLDDKARAERLGATEEDARKARELVEGALARSGG